MRRRSLKALTAATASSTPRSCRQNAPANTLLSSPALRHPLRPVNRTPHRSRRPRLLPPPKPPPTDRMTTNATEAGRTTLCARPDNARLDQVSKLFGSFAALRQVSLSLQSGRCYVLLGENGAGKSTLLR